MWHILAEITVGAPSGPGWMAESRASSDYSRKSKLFSQKDLQTIQICRDLVWRGLLARMANKDGQQRTVARMHTEAVTPRASQGFPMTPPPFPPQQVQQGLRQALRRSCFLSPPEQLQRRPPGPAPCTPEARPHAGAHACRCETF